MPGSSRFRRKGRKNHNPRSDSHQNNQSRDNSYSSSTSKRQKYSSEKQCREISKTNQFSRQLTDATKTASSSTVSCAKCGTSGTFLPVNQRQGTSSQGNELDIPGFYYDKEKKRYFKIAPNHSKHGITQDSITKKEAEDKRKRDEKILLEPKSRSQEKVAHRNIVTLLQERTSISQNIEYMKKSCLMSNVTHLKPLSKQNVFEMGPPQQFDCNLEHMQQMLMWKNHDEILGLWSLRDTWKQRLQLLKVSEKRRQFAAGSLSISATPHQKVIIQSLNKVTDLCWAPMPGELNRQTILYTTVCHTGYQYSLAMIRSLNSDEENDRRIVHDYNLGKKATWTCAWNYHRQQFSVGSEKSALMLNIERRTLWDYNTNNSDPLSQTFSHQTGNYFINGTRKGQILMFDLRSRSSYPKSTFSHNSSVGSLNLLQDDTSLLASDFTGRICLWDLRQARTVVEYSGNVNQYTKLPVHVDETEHVMYTVGEDGYTRFWDLKQGTLLHTIPPPCAISRETIPSILYSARWGDRQGNAGLIMGLGNKLHFYGALQLG